MTDDNKKFLQVMKKYAPRVSEAKTIGFIMKKMRYKKTRETFQRVVIGHFRDNGKFIGTNGKGIFLIGNKKSFEAAEKFYVERISVERKRLKRLRTVRGKAK